jgi:2-methylaconitate cis-trans-isomerase PrpF
MRGVASKGAYFLASGLPADKAVRDQMLLAAMGSPDGRQVDDVGGADSLTSRVAIISAATLRVEHPTGELSVQINFDRSSGAAQVRSAAPIRTAGWLLDGNVRVPQRVWLDKKAA